MTLIDALHINDSGGKILLDYLIKSIEESNIKVTYILDKRVKGFYTNINNNVLYIKSTFINRLLFYLRNKNKFKKVFCFGNIPPPINLKAKSYTYFHQKLFLLIPKEFKFIHKLSLHIKSKVVKQLSNNTDFWIVQSNLMKKDLLYKFNNNSETKVLVHPFYPPLNDEAKTSTSRVPKSFLYVSTYNPQKNFEKLIDAFKLFYDKYKKGQLHLTLVKNDSKIISTINNLILKGYPIINHGFIKRDLLTSLYSQSEFIIYPSLSESFGLGIVEGIENGCQVIGADLPYTYAVCKPSITFDPKSVKSIIKAFEIALNTKSIIKTEQLVFNEIDSIIKLINKN